MYLQAEEADDAPACERILTSYPRLAVELRALVENRRHVPQPFHALPAPQAVPSRIGGFDLVEKIGAGGMAVVYKARDVMLNQLVALKIHTAADQARPEDKARFRKEAEAARRLHHPNILPVYQIGEDQGRLYLVMQLVHGGSLKDKLDQSWAPPQREAAALLRTLALAVHYAHEHNVIHRDLKPGNILLTPSFEPRIADFGLAKRLDDGQQLTLSGQVLGTPGYMAPEQAAGNAREVGPPTDVYALGVILYELLTGLLPFRAASLGAILDQVQHVAAPPLKQFRPDLDPDLEWICRKCLHKKPQDRYPSALHLANALGRYLDNLPQDDRPHTAWELLGRLLSPTRNLVDTHTARKLHFLQGGVAFAAQLAIFLLTWYRGPEWLIWLALLSPYPSLFAIFGYYPRPEVSYMVWADRVGWSIWVGHLLATLTILGAARLLHGPDAVSGILAGYPAVTALTGLAYFVMGAVYWGRHYLFGALWLLLALLMVPALPWAPLGYGLLALYSCIEIGRYPLVRAREQAKALR
jgi:serine/threonine-protein kinase